MTTKHIRTGEIVFSLVYGAEAIIPVDICMPTLRTWEIEQEQNATQLLLTQVSRRRGDGKLRYTLPLTSNKSKPPITKK